MERFIQRTVQNGWNVLVKAVPRGAGQILRAQGEPAFSSWGEEIVVLKGCGFYGVCIFEEDKKIHRFPGLSIRNILCAFTRENSLNFHLLLHLVIFNVV